MGIYTSANFMNLTVCFVLILNYQRGCMIISVSIVDYNKGQRVAESLQYLEQQSVSNMMNVSIVDNSLDFSNTLKYTSLARNLSLNVNVFRPSKNIGYTVATNSSVDVLSDFVVILNPDILLKDEKTIENCIDYIVQHEEVGIVGVQQLDDDGNVELVSRKYPDLLTQIARRGGRKLGFLFKSRIDCYENSIVNSSNRVSEVDWLQSSFWVMRTDLWNKVGGLDTDFFLFMSEPEFSMKVKKLGLKIVFLPHITVFSDGIRCSGGGFFSVFKSKTLRIHIADAFKYYIKRLFYKFD
jgi:GT2 family glycosyltransferase